MGKRIYKKVSGDYIRIGGRTKTKSSLIMTFKVFDIVSDSRKN